MPEYYEQPQPQYQGGRFIEQYNLQMDPSIAKLQLDMTSTINFLEHDLKGERLHIGEDKATGEMVREWRPTGMRMMDDNGVQTVVSVLHTFLNPNTFLTVVDEEDIERIMSRFHRTLAGLLVDKQEEFAIENAYLYILMDKITNIVWLALKRGTGSMTLNAFTKSHKAVETHELAPRKRRFGIF